MADKESQLRLKITAQNDGTQAFTGISDAIKTLQTSLGDISGTFRTLTDSMAGLNDVASKISSALNGTEQSFQSTSTAANAMAQSISSDETDMNSLATSVRNAEGSLNKISDSMANVDRSSAAMATSTEESAQSAASLNDKVGNAGLLIGLQQVGQAMEQIGGMGAGLFKDAITSAADFEGNISRIHAVLMNRDPTANMKDMSDTALLMGQNSKFSANEIAQGMYELA